MSGIPPLTLAQSPELAILRALECTLQLAASALVAANPETEFSDFVCEVPDPSVQACLADAINVHVGALQCALRNYSRYVENEESRHRCRRTASASTQIQF